jgi:hypothetical protein
VLDSVSNLTESASNEYRSSVRSDLVQAVVTTSFQRLMGPHRCSGLTGQVNRSLQSTYGDILFEQGDDLYLFGDDVKLAYRAWGMCIHKYHSVCG